MDAEKCNRYGLFDTPIHTQKNERIPLSQNDIERQLDAGAFFMSEAIEAGFLCPYAEPDTVIVDVQEDV